LAVSFFITGTDTGVGKTHTITQILQRYNAAGKRAAGMKPICCGDRDDATKLLAAGCEGLTIEQINPIWLKTPVAPLVAARTEGREIDIEEMVEAFRSLQALVPMVFVEGVGGWQVPITADCRVSDFARLLGLPVLVVVLNRLGCLNHAVLTVESIRSAGLKCSAILLNEFDVPGDLATATNREILREICAVPVILGAEIGTDSMALDRLLGL
jgi:dethiobiotin synthetase